MKTGEKGRRRYRGGQSDMVYINRNDEPTEPKKGTMKISVKQGSIHVNSVHVMQKTDEVIYLSIDCRQKYPEVSAFASGPEDDGESYSCSIYLDAEPGRTLNVDDPDAGPTEVEVSELQGTWHCTGDAGRYSVMFIMVRPSEEEWPWMDWADERDEEPDDVQSRQGTGVLPGGSEGS